MTETTPIYTRVGHTGAEELRFYGKRVFARAARSHDRDADARVRRSPVVCSSRRRLRSSTM